MLRENATHWEWLVYLEMFVAGVAAGAYATAALLEVFGRGRSPAARAAHLIAFPLMILAAILLTVDLSRPERFLHMLVQSKTLLPMFKPWSPMSVGSWLVLLFPAFAFVSFVDALIAGGVFRLGGWRATRTLHGTPLGLIWAVIGAALGLAVASYSGVLLSVTNFGGWSDSPLIGAVYVATAAVNGVAAVLLIEAWRGRGESLDAPGLSRVATALVVWQMLLLLAFFLTMGAAGWRVFLTGLPFVAVLGAIVLGGLVPLGLRFAQNGRARPALTALFAASILLGGFLVRYAVVMGPQQGRFIPGAA